MKKLKNPVYLETVCFPLTKEEDELFDLEIMEMVESTTPVNFKCRINAIHAGTTKNFHTYPLEELEKSAVKWTKPYGKPILKNHNMDEEPMGRIQEASVIKYGNNEGVLSVVASIPDKVAAEKIKDQRYITVSVGVASRNVTCSVCGVNWYESECEHDVGRSYKQNESDREGTLCTAEVRDIQPIELSFVNLPADADESRFAGVVTFGESEDLEFFSESSTGVAKHRKRKASDESDDLRSQLKETWQDFLSQLTLQGEETQEMDEKTKAQETGLEEEQTTEDEATATEQELDGVSEELSEETTDGESAEEEITSDEAPVKEESTSVSELADLDEYLSDSEDVVEEESTEEEDKDSELLNRVSELEDEVASLKQLLADQETAASETAKNVRAILARHIVDLTVILNKAGDRDLKELEEEESASTIKEQVAKLKELRKEFKESDYKVLGGDSNLIEKETLPNSDIVDLPEDQVSEAQEEETSDDSLWSEAEIIRIMTEQLSQSRPYKRKGQ